MKINFDSEILSLDHQPLKPPESMNLDKLTLKSVCIESLMFNEEGMSGEQKFSNYQLARKISAGGEVDCSVEELALIKKRIGLAWGVNVVGPAWSLLEQTV